MDVLELVRKVRSLDESLLPKSYKLKAEKVLAEGLSSIESAETDEEKKEMVTRAMALVQQILNVVEANRTLKASLLDPMSITAQDEEEVEAPEDLEAEEGSEEPAEEPAEDLGEEAPAEEEGSEEPAEDMEEDEDLEDEDLGDDLDQIQAEVDELLSELDAEESEESMPDVPEVDEDLALEEAPEGEISEDSGEELSLETGEEDLSLDDNDLELEEGGNEADFEDITPELESDAEAELDLMDQAEGASEEEDLGGEIDGDAEILEDMEEGEGESMPDPMKIESSKSSKKSLKDEIHQHVNDLLKDLI